MTAPYIDGWRATLHSATRRVKIPKFLDLGALAAAAPTIEARDAGALLMSFSLDEPSRELDATIESSRDVIPAQQRGALLEEMMRQWEQVSYNVRYLYLMRALNTLSQGASVHAWLFPRLQEMLESAAGARARKASFAVGAIEGCGGPGAIALLRQIGDDMRADPMQRRAARFAALRLLGTADAEDDDEALVAELIATRIKRPTVIKNIELPDLYLLSNPDEPIPSEATESLAVWLSKLVSIPHDGVIERARLALDPRSTGALADTLYDAWAAKGFHGRHKSLKYALAVFADDRVAVKLESSLRTWPHQGDTGRKRAIYMMDVLVDIGTDTALMVLLYLSFFQDVPSVWDRAKSLLTSVARTRRVSVTRLGDLIIPDCGLDERGERMFEVRDREIKVVFDENFDPRLVDVATDERLEQLPEVDGGEHARQDWALMSETIEEVIKVQSARLEQAMVTDRRWSQSDWNESIFNHPLMINYARRLVWGMFDKDDDLVATFRATEDRELVDVEDDTFTMPRGLTVGLVHPLHLTRELLAAWSQSFGDYEIFSPIEQLGRATHGAADGDFAGETFEAGPFKAGMKRNLWRRNTDGGSVRDTFTKSFGHGVSATIKITPGFYPGSGDWGEDQKITSITLGGGKNGRGDIAYSEAVRDLEGILASTHGWGGA